MEEEFQESEVIFPESWANREDDDKLPRHLNSRPRQSKKQKGKEKDDSQTNSIPVNIQRNIAAGSSWFQGAESEDEGELVPPHVIVGRRIAGNMEFSMCTGNGRTLKGRDLSRVRNSVLRMTGFLEP